MASMADHLRSHEYARMHRSKTSALAEPQLSDDVEQRLVDAYERSDTSASDYLAMVTECRPFTPPSTSHTVIIDSGTYCSTMAMPVVFNSFLQDRGSSVVEELLSRFEISLVEKAPMGGILLHVRSSEAERKLVGQAVVLLGRKFKIKRQSPFVNKFYLDIFGVGSTNTANELFMGLAALGAMPMFLTPRDVNMDAHMATPTWRFYFGQDEPPLGLMIRGFITNQLVSGRKMYTTRGRRSLAPPERAVSFKRSPYAVILPSRCSPPRNVSGGSAELRCETTRNNNTDTSRQLSVLPEPEYENTHDQDRSNKRGEHPHPAEMSGAHQSVISQPTRAIQVEPRTDAQIVVSVDQTDFDMNSVPSDEDVDMVGQMESGSKRLGPSFADANPYDVLDMLDCAFDAFEPETSSE